jgi:hypothetical protein
MSFAYRVAIGGLLAVASASSASATAQDWKRCLADTGYPAEEIIAGCTAVLQSGADSWHVLWLVEDGNIA